MKAHNKGEGFKSVGVRPRDRITQPHFQPYLRVYVQRLRAEDPHRQLPLVSFAVIKNSKARLKPPRSSLSATSGLEVEKPATGSVCALTVLGELDELSSSSGESSSSSGSVGMAGGSEGRERV